MAALYTLPGGSAKVANRTITSGTTDTSDLVIEGQAVLELDTSTVSNSGSVSNPLAAEFYGLGATIVADDAAIYLNSDTVSSTGNGVPAMFVTDGGALRLFGTTVSTSGAGAPAVELINGSNAATGPAGLRASTTGANAPALTVGAGSGALMYGGSLSTSASSSDAIVASGAVNLTSTTVAAGRSFAALDGAAALTTIGGSVTAGGTGILVQSSSGNSLAVATISLGSTSIAAAGDLFDVVGASANITILGGSLSTGSGTVLAAGGGSTVNLNISTNLSGAIVADATSVVNVALNLNTLTGRIVNASLRSIGTFISTGPSHLTSLDVSYGSIAASSGLLSIGTAGGTDTSYGVIGANGGTVAFTDANFSNSGHLTIETGGTIWVAGGAMTGGDVLFADGTGTLRLDSPGAFRSAIGGFQPGDVLDLGRNTVSFAGPSPYSNASLHLLVDGTAANLSMPGTYPGSFHLGQGGNGDAVVFYTAS